MSSEHSVVIVGAGFGGIGVAIELQHAGFEDVVLLEAAPALGGTWYWNTYPGAACDVPSHLYSYSFAQRRDWSRLCSPQEEILRYVGDVARHYGIDRLVETDTFVVSCAWDSSTARWTVTSRDGRSWSAPALVIATGQLNQPSIPRIEGAFAGYSFHSARWDHSYDLRGKRVAVVGTGASAVQFVPEVAEQAAQLTVFQRSGNWFLPRENHLYPPLLKWCFEHVPGLQAYRRNFIFNYGETLTAAIRYPNSPWARLVASRSARFMRSQLVDPEVRRKAWPDYTFGCKRVLFSSAFLPALQRPNVSLVVDAVTRLTPAGIVTADGVEREFDCVIWGTGFHTDHFMLPMEVSGVGGASLRDAWSISGPRAHLGVTVPGFPSLFLMYGPNTNTSGGSIIFYGETQAAYIRQALEHVRDRGAAAIDVRPEVAAASDAVVQARFDGTAWTKCDSWYRDERGRIITNWPGYMRQYAAVMRELDPSEFTFLPLTDRARDLWTSTSQH